MLDENIISPSQFQQQRVIDYWKVNEKTLDLASGFHQIKMVKRYIQNLLFMSKMASSSLWE